MPITVLRQRAAGNGDDRRACHVWVAQAGGEVRRTDVLRHADFGPARGAGVAVGHVNGRLLAMRQDAADSHAFHRGERFHEDSGHEEDM